MHISLKNLALAALLLGSIAGIPLTVWWWIVERGAEPIVALVTAVVGAGFAACGIDWKNFLITGAEHDCEIFRKGDEILPESTVQLVVGQVQSTHSRNDVELEQCDRFHYFCTQHGNAFLCQNLQTARNRFNAALGELGAYTAIHFFPVSTQTYKLYPELLQRLDHGDPEEYKRYTKYRAELEDLAREVATAYRDYRVLAKKRLKL